MDACIHVSVREIVRKQLRITEREDRSGVGDEKTYNSGHQIGIQKKMLE